MKYLIPDFETSNHNKGNPFDPRNFPVSLSVLQGDTQRPGWRRIYAYYFLNESVSNCTLNDIALLLEKNGKDHWLVGHNLRFDIHWLDRIQLRHGERLWDTMFLPYLEWEGQAFKTELNLAALSGAKNALGDRLIHTHGLNPSELSPYIVLSYNVQDVIATEKLFLEQVGRSKLFRKPLSLMFNLLPVIIECERNGFKVDLLVLEGMYKEQLGILDELVSNLVKRIEEEFGVSILGKSGGVSRMKVSEFLYSLKLKKEKKLVWSNFVDTFRPYGEKQEKEFWRIAQECFDVLPSGLAIEPSIEARGKLFFSTDVDTLKMLLKDNPDHPQFEVIEKFHEISRLNTLIGTYLEGILGDGDKKEAKYFDSGSGAFIHTSHSQTTTATGRLASSKPNLHNWPREDTFPVKQCIVSRFPGGHVGEGDASQIELRYAGWYYNDNTMRVDYENNIDIHGEVGRQAYGEGYTDEQRTISKSVVFRTLYRGGPWGIVKDPKIPIWNIEEVKKLLGIVYGRYEGLKKGQEKDLNDVIKNNGLMVTPTGRRFRFKLDRFNLKNLVANYPIQSGATADFIPCAMIVAHRRMREEGVKSLMMGQVHDSLIFDVYPGEEKQIEEICTWALTTGGVDYFNRHFELNFDFPLGADWKIKEHW